MLQLFLIEALVERLHFPPGSSPIPKKSICVTVKFDDISSLSISSEGLDGRDLEEAEHQSGKKKNVIEFNTGQSHLFPCNPNDLMNRMKKSTLELAVANRESEQLIGEVTIPWVNDFINMVESSKQSTGYTTPAAAIDSYELRKANKHVGKIDVFLRLSCFGDNIQTQFQLQTGESEAPTRFLFKSTNTATTFHCEKFGGGTSEEAVPVAPLYHSTNISDLQSELHKLAFSEDDDTISLIKKPEEKKYMTIMFVDPDDDYRQSVTFEGNLTANRINGMLCKNADCPGVKKFMELGMGVLANRREPMEPKDVPLATGMNHTCGMIETFGTEAPYKKPKSLDQPFTPKDRVECYERSCLTTPGCNKLEVNASGGSKTKSPPPPKKGQRRNSSCGGKPGLAGGFPPMRLRGGAVDDGDGKPMATPMSACKDLMDGYDKVLAEYRKALGPCGQSTCAFAPNVIEERCKRACSQGRSGLPCFADDQISACGVPDCPSSRPTSNAVEGEFKRKQTKSACGSNLCPYAKAKVGLGDASEAAMVADVVAAAKTGGSIPANLLKPLDPIHWDCPEPLPKGLCKNPDCPLMPRLLKYFKPPVGPCGGIACPEATSPCGNPSCTAGGYEPDGSVDVDCDNPACPNRSPKGSVYEVCDNPACPHKLSKGSVDEDCDNPACPYKLSKGSVDVDCDNPACPNKSPKGSVDVVCDNPACPHKLSKESVDVICDNPACPYKPRQTRQPCAPPRVCPFDMTACPFFSRDYPAPTFECPFASQTVYACTTQICPMTPPPCYWPPPLNVCNIPNCPYSTPPPPTPCQPPQTCNGPTCPFANTQDSGNVCDNPACPVANGKAPSSQVISICSNPDCPFAADKRDSGSVCSNPECPSARKSSPPVPPPCGIPGCPFDLQPVQQTHSPTPTRPGVYEIDLDGAKLTVEYGAEGDCRSASVKSATIIEEKKLEKVKSHDDHQKTPEKAVSDKKVQDKKQSEKKEKDKEGDAQVSKDSITRHGSKRYSQQLEKIPEIPPPQQQLDKVSSGGDKKAAKEKVLNKKGQLVSSSYIARYPGALIGHRDCAMGGFQVPPRMGWLWNIFTPCLSLKPRRGWRPGAVAPTIAARIIAHKRKAGCNIIDPFPQISRKKKRKGEGSDSDATIAPKSTFKLVKEKGCYYINVNPLKDPDALKSETESPYLDCTPLQFKITKNKKFAEEAPGKTCYCNDPDEPPSDSSDSLDIEFTPPAGIVDQQRFVKPVLTTIDTQYDPVDFAAKGKDEGGKKPAKGKKGKGKKGKGKKGKK